MSLLDREEREARAEVEAEELRKEMQRAREREKVARERAAGMPAGGRPSRKGKGRGVKSKVLLR